MKTYRAIQISYPGKFELVERAMPQPGFDEVVLRVEACGICGADAGVIEGLEKGTVYPRVPGHEVVGRIISKGSACPSRWKVGDRVGVGRLGGHCNDCRDCFNGDFSLCDNQPITGSSKDGGYAEAMVAKYTGLVSIPDDLTATHAAPLLCAGVATFNALKRSGAEAGDLVAIQGIGGLGHLAVQYAHRMGFKVAAIGRRADIKEDALSLGAHLYLDADETDPAKALEEMGGAQAIVTTITDSVSASKLFRGLASRGKLMVLGVGHEPITVSPGALVGCERIVQGSLTGTPLETEKTFGFSVLTNAFPMVETLPFEKAEEGYLRMRSGKAKFRMALVMA